MKKIIYRLTENDLHNLIKETVTKILKEDVLDNNNMSVNTSVVNDIDDVELDTIDNKANEAVFNGYGKDGSTYQIYAKFYVSEGEGVIPSYDYDVPDDYDADTINISDVHITKWNEDNEEIEVPYVNDFKFENELESQIEDELKSKYLINNH